MPDQHRKRLMQSQPRQRSHKPVRTGKSDSGKTREVKQIYLKGPKLEQGVSTAYKLVPVLEPAN
jgi:hypothetical protein